MECAMRKGILGALVALWASAGLAWADPPTGAAPGIPTQPPTVLGGAAPVIATPPPTVVGGAAPGIATPPPTVLGGAECCGAGLECLGDCCKPRCVPCGPPGRFWVSGEYLLWWFRGDAVPPLVTTGSPFAGLAPGALGNPDTV